MKYGIWCAGMILMASACVQQKHNDTHRASKKATTHVQEKKKEDKKPVDMNKPVATLTLNGEDEVTDNDFTVEIYPTGNEEIFKINIQYGGNTASDELKLLPKSYYEKIALKKGNGDHECIVGFIDKKGKFNEIKLVTASGTHIGIKTLKAYYLSTK